MIAKVPGRTWLLPMFLLLICVGARADKPEYIIKFATLAPPGSAWMKLLRDWDKELRAKSDGRLGMKFYPGGVQGDEPEILNKMRFNSLQGGAFTGYGIGRMYSPARVMELPFLFHNTKEIDFVRRHFMPRFRAGFRDKGYELLGWMEVGFVHIFSTKPINSLDEMKSRRVWLWQGDPMGEAFFEASGIAPVPLSIVDVYTSLSTGLIDTVYAPPLGAVALQWFTKTPYVSTVPLTDGIGGLIVSKRFYDRLPPDLQKLLSETGEATGEKLISTTRVDNEKALQALKKRGLKFVPPGKGMSEAELLDLRDRAAAKLISENYIPADIFEQTRKLLEQCRTTGAGASASTSP